MLGGKRRKLKLLIMLLCGASFVSYAKTEKKIDFYGVASSGVDKNMLKMTADLYYNQLKDFSTNAKDYRKNITEEAESENSLTVNIQEDSALAFYVFITKKDGASNLWSAKVFLQDVKSGKVYSSKKEYPSYYKILMESKSSLSSILDNLLLQQEGINIASPAQEDLERVATDGGNDGAEERSGKEEGEKKKNAISDVTGTWIGEEEIAKAVILSNGRGFVIFKNGASMNISVVVNNSASTSHISIKQTSTSNAAYYPELEKSVAIDAAKSGNLIEWSFTNNGEASMYGKKTTLIKDKSKAGWTRAILDVEWKRQ